MLDPTSDQKGPLQYKSSDEKVVADATVSVALEESHKEAETNEHHGVNVHEHAVQFSDVITFAECGIVHVFHVVPESDDEEDLEDADEDGE